MKGHFPDFLILGPQRTGTTWLYQNLSIHPQVFLAYPKEIQFFNVYGKKDHTKHRSDSIDWYLKYFHDTPWTFVRRHIECFRRWGEPYAPAVRGEATASYAILSEKTIRQITHYNPEIKVILILRHPIDRAWSHAKKALVQKGDQRISDISIDEFESFFRRPRQIERGQYSAIIDRWSSHLRSENIFIGWFDDIKQYPADLILRIFRFLGVRDSAKYIGSLAHRKINPTFDDNIPKPCADILHGLFDQEIQTLRERFNAPWSN